MREILNNCLKGARKLLTVILTKTTRVKATESFYKCNAEGALVVALVTPLVLSKLQELEEILRQMTSQDFGSFLGLVNTPDLTFTC